MATKRRAVSTFDLLGYRIEVSDGCSASVYRGERKIGNWIIGVNARTLAENRVSRDEYVAMAAAVQATETEEV